MYLHFLFLNFSDLVHTTESLRKSKLSAVKAEKESANFDFVLEPYKLENAKLIRENNELYLELMKLREHSGQRIKGKVFWFLKCNIFALFVLYVGEASLILELLFGKCVTVCLLTALEILYGVLKSSKEEKLICIL